MAQQFKHLLDHRDQRSASLFDLSSRDALTGLAIEHAYSTIDSMVTISAGVAESTRHCPCDAEAPTAAGDQALYQANHHGRNSISALDILALDALRKKAGRAMTAKAWQAGLYVSIGR